MDPPQQSIVYNEIEKALRDAPISPTWDNVTQVNITDPRAAIWRRYKELLSGVDPEERTISRTIDSELNEIDVGSESLIWKDLTCQTLQTFNKLFPDARATHLSDAKCASKTLDEIKSAYIQSIDNDDVLLKNSVLIDVICDPVVKKFSQKIGDVGICCNSELLRSKSKTVPLNYLCGKRTDLCGITDWVMKRYGGNRRESSLYVTLMWTVSWFQFLTCGNFKGKMIVDSAISFVGGTIADQVISSDGDRTTHAIDKTVLAKAAQNSVAKSIPTSTRLRLGFETIIVPRRAFTKEFTDMYKAVSSTANPKDVTPKIYMMSRCMDGMCTSFYSTVLFSDYGEAFDTMSGSIYISGMDTGSHYNDICDAVMDLKYMESHNYVICAKATNSDYSFSDHAEALYVALTTFTEPYNSYGAKIKRRLTRYRFSHVVYYALWPRYRASERARRYVGSLSKEERNSLIERGRRCVEGDVYIKENIWLDEICKNYNHRRAEIQERGYAETFLYVLGVVGDESVRGHIHGAVKAIGMRPFDTALELVMSLGSVWLAKLALRSVTDSSNYDDLVAELSDLLNVLSLSSMPIISDNTITPCESICGPLCFRLSEILIVVGEINAVAGEAIMNVLTAVVGMVSLDPYRCVAHQADAILMSK